MRMIRCSHRHVRCPAAVAASAAPPGPPLEPPAWRHQSDQYGQAVAIDATGNFIVAGTFWGSNRPGGGALASAGMTDIFLAQVRRRRHAPVSRRFGDPASRPPHRCGGRLGNVALAVSSAARWTSAAGGLTSAGSQRRGRGDVRRHRRAPVEPVLRRHQCGLRQPRWPSTPRQRVVAGSLRRFGGLRGGAAGGAGGADIFLASYNAAGVHRWSKSLRRRRLPGGKGALGGSRTARAGGASSRAAWTLAAHDDQRGRERRVVAVFDSTGTFAWSHGFGDAQAQSCLSVAMDDAGKRVGDRRVSREPWTPAAVRDQRRRHRRVRG